MNISQFVLVMVFNKYVTEDGEVIYWRDCVLEENMHYGTQGYLWVYSDGNHIHSYRTPIQVFGN